MTGAEISGKLLFLSANQSQAVDAVCLLLDALLRKEGRGGTAPHEYHWPCVQEDDSRHLCGHAGQQDLRASFVCRLTVRFPYNSSGPLWWP